MRGGAPKNQIEQLPTALAIFGHGLARPMFN